MTELEWVSRGFFFDSFRTWSFKKLTSVKSSIHDFCWAKLDFKVLECFLWRNWFSSWSFLISADCWEIISWDNWVCDERSDVLRLTSNRVISVEFWLRVKVNDCQNPEFKILDCQNPEFKILDCQNPEFKILDCQYSEFKIWDCQNPEFKILDCQKPEFKILDCQNPEFRILYCQNPEFKMDEESDSANDQGNITQSSSSFNQHDVNKRQAKH